MECIEFSDEIVLVLVPICHSLESSDLIVDALEWSTGDWVVVPVEDSAAMTLQRVGHGHQHSDSGCAGSTTPVCQKSGREIGRAHV